MPIIFWRQLSFLAHLSNNWKLTFAQCKMYMRWQSFTTLVKIRTNCATENHLFRFCHTSVLELSHFLQWRRCFVKELNMRNTLFCSFSQPWTNLKRKISTQINLTQTCGESLINHKQLRRCHVWLLPFLQPSTNRSLAP